MNKISNHLDEIEKSVMNELKDFQKATVERIDYLYRNDQKRILVSDEVGLGKTLVARGTIAKFAQLRKKQEKNLVKVVYICSNSNIAEQNLDKLRLVQDITVDDVNTSRLSMQHLNIFMQENDEKTLNRFIKLIPLTPDTSFITRSQGIKEERALIFSLLKEVPNLKQYVKELDEFLSFDVGDWDDKKNDLQKSVDLCNEKSNGDYLNFMVSEISNRLDNLDFSFIEFLESYKRNEINDRESKNCIIRLRSLFADISLNRLNPDLIIMDEFQRFKNLLTSDKGSDMYKLSNKFFKNENLRILMLSATPYKMYSTLDEITENDIDEHYSEFFDVMNFLNVDEVEKVKFEKIWNNYSMQLKEFSKDYSSFITIKNKAEDEMYKHVCRTERISENQLSDIIDDSDAKSLNVLEEDITSFINAQKLVDNIGLNINVPVDYVKSSPYIMSFMNNYKLKKDIENYFKMNPDEINKMNKDTFWLNEKEIDKYNKISFNNARLTNLMTHVLKDHAEKLLWIPPSKPYYDLKGVFANTYDFSKTIIFSSWEMVPRMISSLVSYEIERKTIGKLDSESHNLRYFAEKTRYPSSRLNFRLNKNNKPAQLSLLTLMYPSKFLIDAYDPIDCLNRKLSLEQIESEIKIKIKRELNKINYDEFKNKDLRWYYLAPLLLDSIYDKTHITLWFKNIEELINEKKSKREESFSENLKKHFYELKKIYLNLNDFNELGDIPDDLCDILCDMAISSAAICIYRSYTKQTNDNSLNEKFNKYSFEIARRFIRFMDSPESIAVIDLIYKSISDDAYWKNVLKYSKEGNLQAVFDEYIYLLASGLIYESKGDKISIINRKLLNSFKLNSASYEFDTFDSFKSRIYSDNKSNKKLRTHFAVSFIKGDNKESGIDRRKSVKDSFNSPFRPFVLASTSIGQEGLDFHYYCRRIVHWNLPTNPIDLEQREGRINRYGSLVIRQNIAKRYDNQKFKNDIWEELFSCAAKCEGKNSSDLIPYWGLKEKKDMIKIERIIPMYPFSKDKIKYKRLIKILSLYRLTLGQVNQEYLIDSIFENLPKDFDEDKIKELFINLSPYYK